MGVTGDQSTSRGSLGAELHAKAAGLPSVLHLPGGASHSAPAAAPAPHSSEAPAATQVGNLDLSHVRSQTPFPAALLSLTLNFHIMEAEGHTSPEPHPGEGHTSPAPRPAEGHALEIASRICASAPRLWCTPASDPPSQRCGGVTGTPSGATLSPRVTPGELGTS